jgi:hypothetical protein
MSTKTLAAIVPRDRAAEFFKLLQQMPSLSHYPDRSQPYCDEKSEVFAHIKSIYDVEDFDTARRIFDTATRARVIMFDRNTLRWKGNPFWKGSLQGIGRDHNVLERYRRGHHTKDKVRFGDLPSLKQLTIKKRIADGIKQGAHKTALRRRVMKEFNLSLCTWRFLFKEVRKRDTD